ncbi:hypothetical protein [Schleiferilactobacillus shenzhenensis]|uniref:Uncharacterized protein n=1 Tax=Schleiferilactobacillus shenzhenensis LY-73 TaxID=1231336 RepID=U4TRD0_9LACO|nr:hypothetical protein [Schleiferilactobacillus shenzhenensis]ERL64448.1 hypothetical protein L248_0990 [Schleiferilactobacillus shenzhenensis LY-73]
MYFKLLQKEIGFRKIAAICLITITMLSVLFWIQIEQQHNYIESYRGRLVKNISSLPAAGKKTQDDAFTLGSKYELTQLNAGPIPYAQAYLKSLEKSKKPINERTSNAKQIVSRATGTSLSGPAFSQTELDNTIKELSWVLKRDITPFYPSRQLLDELTPTRYTGDPDKYDETAQVSGARFYTNGWYFVWYVVHQNIPQIFIILGVLLLGLTFANELNPAHRHILLLATNGIDSIHLWAERWILDIVVIVAAITFSTAIFLLGSLIVARGGSLQYPIVLWHINGKQSFMGLGTILTRGGWLLIMFTMLGESVQMFWSVITRNALLTTVLTLLTIGLGFFVQHVSWLPFTYFNVGETINGFTFYRMGRGSFEQAMLVVAIWSVAIAAVSLLLLYRNRKYAYDFEK